MTKDAAQRRVRAFYEAVIKLLMEESGVIDAILADCRPEREEILPALLKIQEKMGYLSVDTMEQVAHFFNLPKAEVYGLVTFYRKLRRQPPGRHPIEVCQGTACYLLGSHNILDTISRELQVEDGRTTADGQYSLDGVACFGCCNAAPVIRIADEIHSRMTPGRVEEVLGNCRRHTDSAKVDGDGG